MIDLLCELLNIDPFLTITLISCGIGSCYALYKIIREYYDKRNNKED